MLMKIKYVCLCHVRMLLNFTFFKELYFNDENLCPPYYDVSSCLSTVFFFFPLSLSFFLHSITHSLTHTQSLTHSISRLLSLFFCSTGSWHHVSLECYLSKDVHGSPMRLLHSHQDESHERKLPWLLAGGQRNWLASHWLQWHCKHGTYL